MRAGPVYKLLRAAEWAEALARGVFDGSATDKADGFIHFSAATQVRVTAAKHFAGESGLILAAVDPGLLPFPLKWEPSRGGRLFPHLYAPLPLSAVPKTWSVPPFPPEIP